MKEESRRSDRHQVRFKLVYDDGDAYHTGLVRDLSTTGVFLETQETLPAGTRVRLSSLEMDADHGFDDLPARVVRVVEPDPDDGDASGLGLEFDALSTAQRTFIDHLIERLEAERASFEGDHDPYFGKNLPREGLRRAPSGVWRAPPDSGASVDEADDASASSDPEDADESSPDEPSPP